MDKYLCSLMPLTTATVTVYGGGGGAMLGAAWDSSPRLSVLVPTYQQELLFSPSFDHRHQSPAETDFTPNGICWEESGARRGSRFLRG